jgi:hypothetical protein
MAESLVKAAEPTPSSISNNGTSQTVIQKSKTTSGSRPAQSLFPPDILKRSEITNGLKRIRRNNPPERLNNSLDIKLNPDLLFPEELQVRKITELEMAREKRMTDIVTTLFPFTPRQAMLLILEEKRGQTKSELAESFNRLAPGFFTVGEDDNKMNRMLDALCSIGFVRTSGKSGHKNLYLLGAKGVAYGQSIAYMQLYTDRSYNISMHELWGSPVASPTGSIPAVNRFKLLERLERGASRVNELAEIIERPGVLRRNNTRSQIDSLKQMKLIEYTFDEEEVRLLLSKKELKAGKLDAMVKKFTGNDIEGLNWWEFGFFRIRMTDDAKDKLGRLIITVRAAIRDESVNPELRRLARNSVNDHVLGMLVATPMSRYMKSHYMKQYSPTPNYGFIPQQSAVNGSQLRTT